MAPETSQRAMKNSHDERTVENATEYTERLRERDDVTAVKLEVDRYPPRITVDFTTTSIPDAVHEMAEKYGATMTDARRYEDVLTVEWTVPEPLRAGGVHKVRMHGGSSTVVTLAPLTVELSGLGEGVKVEQHARENEIVLRRW